MTSKTLLPLVLLLAACGATVPPAGTCDPSSCSGCCLYGICYPGNEPGGCGTGGTTCGTCVVEAGERCIANRCQKPQTDAGQIDAGPMVNDTGCKAKYPTSQGLSAPCCPEHGADACGALLFCAAFDGRTQPTCYPDRSRLDQTECSADQQCVSGACNVAAGKCRSAPRQDCSATIGCASKTEVCARGKCSGGSYGETCEQRSHCTLDEPACVEGKCKMAQDFGFSCTTSAECLAVTTPSGQKVDVPCTMNRCAFPLGARCVGPAFNACTNGYCRPAGATSVTGFCSKNTTVACGSGQPPCPNGGECYTDATCQ